MLKLVTDKIYQPVTLFLPTDAAMAALAQEQKDFLYAMHNREKLAEYLRFHILHDTMVCPLYIMLYTYHLITLYFIIRIFNTHNIFSVTLNAVYYNLPSSRFCRVTSCAAVL